MECIVKRNYLISTQRFFEVSDPLGNEKNIEIQQIPSKLYLELCSEGDYVNTLQVT